MVHRLLFCVLITALFLVTNISKSPAQETADNKRLASEYLLPSSTKAWFSVPDYGRLKEQFEKTDISKLTEDELLKPFIESFRAQCSDWLNEQNIRLGVKIEDLQSVRSGEICIAGVLQQLAEGEQQDSQHGLGRHGLVLMVDVAESQDKAIALMQKVDEEFEQRGAKRNTSEIHGVNVTQWTVQRPELRVKQRSTYHTIADGWLLICDNDNITREIIRRLQIVKKTNKSDTLASQVAFQQIFKNTSIDEAVADARWFVDPFGYLELAQAIEREDRDRKVRFNNWVQILKQEGFYVLHGVGGQISFATGDHELLHRTFVYAPRKVNGTNEKRFFGLFDFENSNGHQLKPEVWVPADVSTHFTACWDMTKAFNNVGRLIDSFFFDKEEGAWDNIIAGLKQDMNVDVPKLVASFDDRVTVISSTGHPITTDSEWVAICLPIRENEEGLLDVMKRAVGGEEAFQALTIQGKEVLLIEAFEDEIPDDEGIWLDPDQEVDRNDNQQGDEVEEFKLFKQKYLTVVHGHFVVTNNKDFLKQIIQGKPQSQVSEADDYEAIRSSLNELIDPEKASFRHFGRVDQSLETNYEMLRQGKMGMSNTMLARILNRILQPPTDQLAENEKPRDQKLDGSKLPADYEKHVGRYFGPMGWVLETDTDGWRVTGCMLKKKQMSEVVQKPSSGPRR